MLAQRGGELGLGAVGVDKAFNPVQSQLGCPHDPCRFTISLNISYVLSGQLFVERYLLSHRENTSAQFSRSAGFSALPILTTPQVCCLRLNNGASLC